MKAGLIIGLGGTGVHTLRHVKAQLVGGEQKDVPANVRLLAFDTVQDQDAVEEEDATMRGVALKPGEYFWIGGDVYDYTTEVRQGRHPHVASWYQAETYLKTLPRASFTLQRGAGQLRQFGRLAIYRDVAAPALSNIRKLINNALTDIRNTGLIANLDVYLVSSVAGGTGAGMFVDIAYLVRMLAQEEQNGQKITLRAFLVLPEAFSAIPGGADASMRARSYAAMRENRRFMVDFAWKHGYPMYYQPGGTGGVWHSELKTKLFDALYHIDGQRANNPLTQTLPEFGVTATIADAVVAMLDDPQDKYGQHNQNVITAAGRNYDAIKGSTAFDSTIGTYTISLPMRQIVESLSYRLMLQTLNAFTAPSGVDDDGYPVAPLKFDANREAGEGVRGRDDASNFLQATEIQSVHSDETIVMTLLPNEMFRLASRYSPQNQTLFQEIVAKTPREWESVLDPTGETPDVIQTRQQVQAELASSLISEVPPKLANEKPQDANARIPPAVERFKAEHLGREDPRSGQRSGGKYRSALEQYTVKHLSRFRDALNLEILNILNGSSQKKPRESKMGKLGYARDMLDGMDLLLGRFLLTLEEAHQLREQLGTRSALLGNVQAARQDMEQKPGGMFSWGGKQKAYLQAEEELVNQIKNDIVEAVLRKTAQAMQEHVRALKSSTDDWSAALAIGPDGLIGRSERGLKRQTEILHRQGQVKVRLVVPEPKDRDAYLEDLYGKYAEASQDGLGAVLNDLQWGLEKRRSGSAEVFSLTLSLSGGEVEPGQSGQARNLELIKSRCAEVFANAWQQESILKYLMRKYPRSEQLAQLAVDNGGPLLSLDGGQPTPANYFHVAAAESKDESVYLDGVKNALVNLSGAKGDLNEVIQSADRFSCRLVYTLDLVPLDQVASYKSARPHYMNYAQRAGNEQGRGTLPRETLHLFPAEVNAAKYEMRVKSELNLPTREFHNDVVLQLEYIDRFKLFVRAWVFGVVRRDKDEVGGDYHHYFALWLPPENLSERIFGDQRELKIYLSLPVTETPSLLEALETFQYIGNDIRPEVEELIPYERLVRAVEIAKSDQVRNRLGRELAIEPAMLKQMIDRIPDTDDPDSDKKRVLRLIAERALIRERQVEVRKDIDSPNNKVQIRDTATVFWLALEDYAKSVQEAIASLLNAAGGIS